MPTLHLICGLPGSGKSTFAKKLENKNFALRLTPDEWMERIVNDGYNEEKREIVEAIQWEIAQKVLSLGADVILEFGFWSRKERDEFRIQAKNIGAETKLYFLNTSREQLLHRLEERNKNLPTHTFIVSESDLDKWLEQFEAPTSDEPGLTVL